MTSIDSLKIPDEKKKYISENLNPVLTELVTECLRNCPEQPEVFMLDWLTKQKANGGGGSREAGGGGHNTLLKDTTSLARENEELKEQIKTLHSTLKEATGMMASMGKEQEDKDKGDKDSDEEEEDDDDMVDELPEAMRGGGGARQSVSAEAYGAWNKKADYTPKIIVKSAEQKDRLRSVLGKSFLFSALDDKEFAVVIDAMEEQIHESGVRVIQQGDDGDCLFVIEEGLLECYKASKDEGAKEDILKTCERGDVFGELALLYSQPRAASVRVAASCGKCVLWSLDRETFNAIVKDAAAQKRQRYEAFLKSVSILKDMTPYELSQIADALKLETFQDGEEIIREGDSGDKFFIVESGAPVVKKSGEQVMTYSSSDYFGELALLMNQQRAATVVAVGVTKVLSLNRKSFKRLLGPLDQIMRRAMDRYNGV